MGLKLPKKGVDWEPLPIKKNLIFMCLLVNLTKRPPKLNTTPFHVKAQSGIFQIPSFSHASQIWYFTILEMASLVSSHAHGLSSFSNGFGSLQKHKIIRLNK